MMHHISKRFISHVTWKYEIYASKSSADIREYLADMLKIECTKNGIDELGGMVAIVT